MAGWQEPTVIEPTDANECRNCVFWVPDPPLDSQTGHCRRMPPTVVAFDGQIGNAFPMTHADEWCGEHRRC